MQNKKSIYTNKKKKLNINVKAFTLLDQNNGDNILFNLDLQNNQNRISQQQQFIDYDISKQLQNQNIKQQQLYQNYNQQKQTQQQQILQHNQNHTILNKLNLKNIKQYQQDKQQQQNECQQQQQQNVDVSQTSKKQKQKKQKKQKEQSNKKSQHQILEFEQKKEFVDVELVDGIKVKFPYKPYEVQIDFMNTMLKALENKENAILESPTGTGKTLSILVSFLGFKEKYPKENYQLMYLSRTHTQVKQLVQQLNKTSYKPKVISLASRNKYCINNQALKKAHNEKVPLQDMCEQECKSGKCPYSKKEEDFKEYDFNQIRDIEDFIDYSEERKICPYYYSKQQQQHADIVFAPYAYAFIPAVIQKIKESEKKIIMVFDEAHNISNEAEKYTTYELPFITLNKIQDFLEKWKDIYRKEIQDMINDGKNQKFYQNEQYQQLLQDFNEGYDQISELNYDLLNYYTKHIILQENELKNKFSQDEIGQYNQKLNNEFHLSQYDNAIDSFIPVEQQSKQIFYKKNEAIKNLQKIVKILKKEYLEINVEDSNKKNQRFYNEINKLQQQHSQYDTPAYKFFQQLLDFIQNIKYVTKPNLDSYDLILEQKQKTFINYIGQEQRMYNLKFLCLDPYVVFDNIKRQLQCPVILTSGSLKPYEDLKEILGLKFKKEYEFQCNHVIDIPKQLKAHIISQTQDGRDLQFSYQYRQKNQYFIYNEFGKSLIEIIKNVPNGVVVFFSSYIVLKECVDYWKYQTSIYQKIEKFKPIYEEPRSMREIVPFFKKYQKQAKKKKGAILFAIARGRLAEGIDFTDHLSRAIIILGIPNLGSENLEVRLKQRYLNELNRQNKNILNGYDWYNLQAVRTTNQCLGRVIRHKHDYGSLFFFDSRFKSQNYHTKTNGFSHWIQEHVKTTQINQETLGKELDLFYKENQKNQDKYIKQSSNNNINLDSQSELDEDEDNYHQNQLYQQTQHLDFND